jgi:hypothetical protein
MTILQDVAEARLLSNNLSILPHIYELYEVTTRSKVLEKPVKILPTFYGTRGFLNVFKSPSLDPIFSQMNAVCILILYFKTNFNIIIPYTPKSTYLFF